MSRRKCVNCSPNVVIERGLGSIMEGVAIKCQVRTPLQKNILHGSQPKLAIYAPSEQSLTCRPVFLFPWIISPIALLENTGKYDHSPPESSLLHIAHVGKIGLIEFPIMKPKKLIEEAYLWHLFSGT